MFDALRRLLAPETDKAAPPDTKLSVAALLVHLSQVDGVVSDDERKMIDGILMDEYGLDADGVAALVEEATRLDGEAVDLYKFTATLSKLEEEERENIIRLLWQLVFADRHMHELEDNMVWRVAELIGVSTRKRTILRNRMKRS